jgi:hypothetical protein
VADPTTEPVRDYADKAIRDALLQPENLRDPIHSQVPELADQFDYFRLRVVPVDFLLPDGRGREADLLFEIPFRVGDQEKIALVCVLLEHQTRPDPRMPLRTLLYVVLYWEKQWSAWEQSPSRRPEFRLAPVLPIVFHTGTQVWGSARTLKDMLGEPTAFHRFAPVWEPLFWELPKKSVDELLSADEAFIRALAVIRAEDAEKPEFEAVLRAAWQRLDSLHASNRERWSILVRLTIGWMIHRRSGHSRQEIAELMQSLVDEQTRGEVTDMAQTIAQSWFAEGKLEGKLEGQSEQTRKIIVRLGSKRFGQPDAGTLSQLNAITEVERLERISDRLDAAKNWADLLATA